MKRKLFALGMIVCLLTIAIAGGTLAYFTDAGTARNVITTGKIQVEIVEEQLTAEGNRVPYEGPLAVMPGATVSKIVSVQAESGAAEAWVRMKVDVEVLDSQGTAMEHTAEQLAQIITMAIGEGWTENGGWYYYADAIADGAQTVPLFEEVTFSGPNMDNRYQNATVTISVAAEAVQKAHNGETVSEAVGWPTEE